MTQSDSGSNQSVDNNSTAYRMKLLGYAGLIPFFVLAIAVHVSGDGLSALMLASLQHYAAIILTFLGAVHWGRALAKPENSPLEHRRLYWAVTPSLIAWVALSLPVDVAMPVIILAFVLCWWIDRGLYAAMPIAGWYIKMRTRLTVFVVCGLVVGWLGV